MRTVKILSVILLIGLILLSLSIDARLDVNLFSILSFDKEAIEILLISRIPRTLTIILTASALSVAGLIMQSIGRNKFVSPGTIGTTQAATLGILISYLFMPTIPIWGKFIFSFGFSMISSFVFLHFISKIQFKNEIYVPLIGMMFGSLIGSISMVIAQATKTEQILAFIGLGSFVNKTVGTYEMILLTVPALILSIIYATRFNIASLGKDFANNLGVNYSRVTFMGLLIVSVISASTFIVVGPLPFLGLIVPNIISIYFGDKLNKNIIYMMIFGSIFVLTCDLISRTFFLLTTGEYYELAVGFTMGIIGSIIFLYLLLRGKKHA
ncbi:ABC transporter permease [Acholeplasma hippikon]|uniref:Iron(III) dicitrate transport system permease protein fecD n=1 Tax=Acholeplasma hippikon TaxID=264636 RepID=A0A449BHX2_9MOLU|nr:iron chelate uptake ABC transporter family permease subunit [Acholeplasma hippikon]VEU82040.1 Iron(III) dicitrate transport system permease protein fecD [Acholeplasma hippikon]